MPSVDRRIVEARFDNKGFAKGVDETVRSVADLNKGLKFEGAGGGLAKLDDAARRLGAGGLTEGLGSAITGVMAKFSALQVIGVTALVSITQKALSAGTQMVKSLTIEPISQGFEEYELKLGAIQTIMAGSGESLDVVNEKLNELNTYADRTIYSFSDMTQNIGKFTNAGVPLDQAVDSIQGIANVAAVSGANSNEASRAMYNFAQALSKGYVQLIDWKSIELANMGTTEFKTQLVEAAEATGELTKQGDSWVTTAGTKIGPKMQGFNEALTDQWLTTEVLNNTLSDYSDETTEIGKKAFAAAQDVKTFTQLIDTVKEAVGSGWAQTFEILIGNFDEAKALFTDINEAVSGFVEKSAEARNKVLGDWKKLGGRTLLIKAITTIFQTLGSVVNTIKDAFKEIFPPATGQQLYELTASFWILTRRFKIGEEALEKIKRVAKGFFAALGIGWEILKGTARFLKDIFDQLFDGSGALLDVAAGLGDFVVKLYDSIKAGDGFQEFFDRALAKLEPFIQGIRDAVAWLGDFVGIADLQDLDFEGSMSSLSTAGDVLEGAWQDAADAIEQVGLVFDPIYQNMSQFFDDAGNWLNEKFENIDYDQVLDTINTGLFGALVLLVNNFMNGTDTENEGVLGFRQLIDDLTSPIKNVGAAFAELTDTLAIMQGTLKATTLLAIAAAVAALTASVVKLGDMDPGTIARGIGAVAGMLAELLAAFVVLQLTGARLKTGLLGQGATALIVMATAVVILSNAVQKLGQMDPVDLVHGIFAVTALVLLLTTAVVAFSTLGGGGLLISTALGLIAMAGAIRVLVTSIALMGGMDPNQLRQGILAVGELLAYITLFTLFAGGGFGISAGIGMVILAGAIRVLVTSVALLGGMDPAVKTEGLGTLKSILLALVLFTNFVDPTRMVSMGAGLVLLAGAIYILSFGIERLGSLDYEVLTNGLAAFAVALGVMALALMAIPPTAIAGAVALGIAALAMIPLALAMKKLGEMDPAGAYLALQTLGLGLTLLVVGLNGMNTALPGAFALLIAAGALAVLTPVLYAIGKLSWDTLLKGLAVLAGALFLLGIAGYALAPVVPTFMGLAIAFAVLGVGVALLGLGILGIGEGLRAAASAGEGAGEVLASVVRALTETIPELAEALAVGIAMFVETLANLAESLLSSLGIMLAALWGFLEEQIPNVVSLLVTLVTELLDALVVLVPKFYDSFLAIIQGFLEILEVRGPELLETFLDILLGLMDVITEKVPEFAEKATDIIVAFIEGLNDNIQRIIDAGADLIIDFLDGMSDAINGNAGEDGIIDSAVNLITDFIDGISDNIQEIIDSGEDLIIEFIEGIGKGALNIADAALDTLVDFLEGLDRALLIKGHRIRAAGVSIAKTMIDGLTGGLASRVWEVVDEAKNIAAEAWEAVKDWWQARSPAKKFVELAQYAGDGIVLGLHNSIPAVVGASEDTAESAIFAMRDSLSGLGDMVSADLNLDPVVTPIIDMSEIRKGAAELDNTFGRANVGNSFLRARTASAAYRSGLVSTDDISAGDGVSINYIQNNNSPKALSSAEIYRQTRNQLSIVRGAVMPNAS